MKRCPKCGQVYQDKDLNFCYNDGELLSYLAEGSTPHEQFDPPLYSNDPPPTEFMRSTRVTSESTWNPPHAAPMQPHAAQHTNWPQQNAFGGGQMSVMQQTNVLAVVSLGLGIGAMTIGWCCSLGLLLSPAAMVTGFIGLSQIKKDPQRFTGRGFGIAGIVTGGVFLALYLLFIIIYGIAVIGGGLAGR